MELVSKLNLARHGREFVRHVVPAVVKPARTLWHEVIGFLFVSLAVIFGFTGARYYLREFDGSAKSIMYVGMAVFLACLMGFYGITSFLKARRISRS